MGNVIFNGISTKDYGIVVQTFPPYEYPETMVESINIEGRNGSLLIDKGTYKNIERTYYLAAEIKRGTSFSQNANRLISWFKSVRGYAKLEDSYEPEYYRLATYKNSGEVNTIYNEAYTVEATFECKPQRFLKNGDSKISFTNVSSGTSLIINNPTDFISYPLINFQCNSSGDKKIKFYKLNGDNRELITEVSIYSGPDNGIINSDLQDCYSANITLESINNKISLTNGFPILYPGKNEIQINSTGFVSLDITPKWWTL